MRKFNKFEKLTTWEKHFFEHSSSEKINVPKINVEVRDLDLCEHTSPYERNC